MQCEPVHEQLSSKYDTQFNFFLTKTTNEIIYNHVLSTNFIDFKDRIIFADNNEYLKRYYYLKNGLDKDEIFDRINLLAEFYGNAVLLKYEYPMMILTKTKSIFLKRLKRMKKYLAEEGSSDESNSQVNEEVVSINSSCFLKTVSSGELDQKSIDDANHLQLEFSLFADDEAERHNIFNSHLESEEEIDNSIFLANITRFTREIACELELDREQKEEEVSHLVVDFDEVDREQVMRKYHKVVDKENRQVNGDASGKQSVRRKEASMKSSDFMPMKQSKIRQLMQRKPMASSITITALDDPPIASYKSPQRQKEYLNKKSMMSPRYSQHLNPYPLHQNSQVKRSTFYQYQLQHNNFPLSNEFVIAQDQLQDSPKNHRRHDKVPIFSAYKGGYSSNRGYTSREKMHSNHNRLGLKTKYSSILNHDAYSKNNHEGELGDRIKPLSLKDHQFKEQYPGYEHYGNNHPNPSTPPQNHQHPQNPRMTSINININNLEENKEENRFNMKIQNRYDMKEDTIKEQNNYRAEKKRKIREKATALLNRVKSQEQMRPVHDHRQTQSGDYNQNYYERYYH